jgi:hypothetical protein
MDAVDRCGPFPSLLAAPLVRFGQSKPRELILEAFLIPVTHCFTEQALAVLTIVNSSLWQWSVASSKRFAFDIDVGQLFRCLTHKVT